MKRLLSSFALGILLLPSPARAQEIECVPSNEAAVRAAVRRLVSELKIAQYRANMALLEDSFGDLEALVGARGTCPESMTVRVCDVECYYQRANVYRFRATGLPLLNAKGGGTPDDALTSPAELLAQATKGLEIVEQGIARLPRQTSSGTGEEQKNIAFNRYLKAMAQLQGLKAKLLVAAGDVWYREASVARLDHMSYLVGEALGDAPAADGDKGSEYYKASTYYDQAFWLVLEARYSLPDRDLFTAELATLATVEKDVTLRLDSVRKGYLYINIDPEDLPLVSIERLGQQLRLQEAAIEQQDLNIQNMLEAWARKYTDLQNQKFDMANLQHSRAIELEVYKVAQIQDMAEQLKNDVQQKLSALQSDISTFELEQRIRVLELALKRETKELQNQIVLLRGQREQDLLALDQDAVREQIAEIQFNIDMTLAAFNFEMQRDGLELQIDELSNRIASDDKELELVDNRKAQIERQIALEQKRIDGSEIITSRLRSSQETVFESMRVPVVHQICSVDAELAFYTGAAQGFTDPISGASCTNPPSIETPKPALLDEICMARKELSTKTKEEIDKIRACIDGSGTSCSTKDENLKRVAEELYNQNLKIYDHQRDMWQTTINQIKARMRALDDAMAEQNSLDAVKGTALALSATAAVLAAIPDGDTGIMGIFPVKTFRIVEAAAAAAKVAADTAAQVYDWQFGELQFEEMIAQERHELDVRVEELRREIAALDIHRLIEEWTKKRALAEISVQLAQLDKEVVEITGEEKLHAIQCRLDRAEIAATVAKLQADRAALVADLQTKSDESALVDFDIDEQENVREQAQIEIQRLTLALGELDIEVSKIQQDKRNLLAMRSSIEAQIGRISHYQGKVHDLEGHYDATREVLNDIREKIRQNTINISEGQMAFLTSVIEDERAATFVQIDDLRRQIRMVEEAKDLEHELLAIEREMRDAVLASRARIMGLVEMAPVNHAAEVLFWDFENMQAELTRGASEFLEAKRRVVENVNFTYNLYRNRYNVLSDFAGDVGHLSPDRTFIGTAAELDSFLSDCGTVGTSEVCRPSSLAWSTETMAGSVAEFTLEKTSGFVSELLENGRARFEISPFAASQEDSRNLGNFVLWDEMTMNESEPMRLVHVLAGISSTSCRSQQMQMTHLGFGTVFSRLSKDSSEIVPSLVVKRPVTALIPVYGGSDMDLMNDEYLRFRRGPYTAEGLERRLTDGLIQNAYPFVGHPLVGTYEITADENLVRCLSQGAPSLKLGFIFVRKPVR